MFISPTYKGNFKKKGGEWVSRKRKSRIWKGKRGTEGTSHWRKEKWGERMRKWGAGIGTDFKKEKKVEKKSKGKDKGLKMPENILSEKKHKGEKIYRELREFNEMRQSATTCGLG